MNERHSPSIHVAAIGRLVTLAQNDPGATARAVTADRGREDQDEIRLGHLCRMARDRRFAVLAVDGERVGTIVGLEAGGSRRPPKRVWILRDPTRLTQALPLSNVEAVDAVDGVVVLGLDRKALDRQRLRLID